MDNRLKGQALGICEIVDALLADIADKELQIENLERSNEWYADENADLRVKIREYESSKNT